MARKSNASVSVVIPCYNGEAYLRETITSALKQTHPPQEILVIDDGSTDGSAAIAQSFGEPVRLYSQPNQGESVARNRGMELARGEWIALLDADDQWTPNKLERQLSVVKPETVCVHTAYATFGNTSERVRVDRRFLLEDFDRVQLAIWGGICPSSAMIRRNVNVRFPTWTTYGEDFLFFLELALTHKAFVFLAEPLTRYRVHAMNQSHSSLIRVEWHKSILEWISRNPGRLSLEHERTIRIGWRYRILRAALHNLRKLNFRDSLTLVQYAAKLDEKKPSLPGVAWRELKKRLAGQESWNR